MNSFPIGHAQRLKRGVSYTDPELLRLGKTLDLQRAHYMDRKKRYILGAGTAFYAKVRLKRRKLFGVPWRGHKVNVESLNHGSARRLSGGRAVKPSNADLYHSARSKRVVWGKHCVWRPEQHGVNGGGGPRKILQKKRNCRC